MYAAQTAPFPKPVVHRPQIKLHQTAPFSPISQFELFFNSPKRVSQSRTSWRKSGRLAVIMSGGSHNKQGDDNKSGYDDGYYMRRCVELAKKAIGRTNPNPMVGCVIVKDGEIVGEGFHPKPVSLMPRDLAENGTAYVSLEPCNHYGRTPPCSEALIKAKVKNVVVGMVDPNPLVASTGVKKLQEAGIKVTVGVEEERCKRLNEVFVHHILTGKPFVTLRYSMSLDGHILDQLGEEAVECGGYYSRLLQEYDAIVLPSTALADKSRFPKSQEPEANQPVTFGLSISPNSQIQIIAEKDTSVETEAVQGGTETLSLDRMSLREILEHCKGRGLCSVLLDLRGDDVDFFEDLIKEGFELNLFQKVVVEVLPIFGWGLRKSVERMDLKAKVKSLTSYAAASVLLEGYF